MRVGGNNDEKGEKLFLGLMPKITSFSQISNTKSVNVKVTILNILIQSGKFNLFNNLSFCETYLRYQNGRRF